MKQIIDTEAALTGIDESLAEAADTILEIAAYIGARVSMSRWLHLPHDARWINPSHIVTVMARTSDDAPPVGYGIVIGLSPAETWVDVIHPLDVAAVTAWLAARS